MHPTARGKTAELWNPISVEVNMDMVGLRANSCPAKCVAMANVMYITAFLRCFFVKAAFLSSLSLLLLVVLLLFLFWLLFLLLHVILLPVLLFISLRVLVLIFILLLVLLLLFLAGEEAQEDDIFSDNERFSGSLGLL